MQKGMSSFCCFAHAKHPYSDWKKLPNGACTPQHLRKILVQFRCKKNLSGTELYAEVANKLLSRVNDLSPGSGPPHWAAFAIPA